MTDENTNDPDYCPIVEPLAQQYSASEFCQAPYTEFGRVACFVPTNTTDPLYVQCSYDSACLAASVLGDNAAQIIKEECSFEVCPDACPRCFSPVSCTGVPRYSCWKLPHYGEGAISDCVNKLCEYSNNCEARAIGWETEEQCSPSLSAPVTPPSAAAASRWTTMPTTAPCPLPWSVVMLATNLVLLFAGWWH